MNTQMNTANTRQPSLTSAVLAQLGIELDEEGKSTLEDIASHSADAGWSGFSYYSDTCAFFAANKADIIDRLKEDAKEFGMDPLAMVAGFGCLKDLKLDGMAIADAIYSSEESENRDTIQNALAWYALEEVARELCPNL